MSQVVLPEPIRRQASPYFSWADFGDSRFVILSLLTCAMCQNVPTNVTISIKSTKIEMIHSELCQNPMVLAMNLDFVGGAFFWT
jgi:hypothetical protein